MGVYDRKQRRQPSLQKQNQDEEKPDETQETTGADTLPGGSPVVTPEQIGIPDAELKAAMKELRPRYKKMLENLAK